MMELMIAGFGAFVLLGFFYSPFPYWPTYFRLWMIVFKKPCNWRVRYKQVFFLIRSVAAIPLWGLFWLADDLIFPAYKKCNIKPVFIIGQPRCGTTLLHRTLAADDETFFAVRHIEWRYPFIIIQKLIALLKIDKWIEKTNYWPNTEAGKIAAKMHPNRLSDWEEDGIFFEENYLHHFFIFLRFPDPELLEYLDSFPELPTKHRDEILKNHHKVLQKVQYLRGGQSCYYLSKEVTSHNKIPFLLERYNDARFILTVRFAEEFMSSLIALMRKSTHAKTGIDPIGIAGWQDASIARMRRDCHRLVALCRDTIPEEHLIHVSANDYMQKIDIATEEIYRSLDLPFKSKFRAYLMELVDHQKKRDRGYSYEKLVLEGFDEYDQFVAEVVIHFKKRMASLNL